MNLIRWKKRKKKKINLNPNIIFYQGEVYKGLEKKKLLHLDTNLVQPHYFTPFCGNSHCDTFAYLGPNCNLRLKPRQRALLEESFQCNHRQLKQSSWHDTELSAKAEPTPRDDAAAKAGFRGLCTELDPRGPPVCVMCSGITAQPLGSSKGCKVVERALGLRM